MAPIACLLAPLAVGMFPPSADARDILAKSLARSFGVNIVALIVQRDPTSTGMFQTVSVERDKAGRVHHTILQPLRLQGVESVDDLERSRIYFPDKSLVVDQESPQKNACDSAWRVSLTCQNYQLKLSEGVVVAGRKAARLDAIPRATDLPHRRFYLDASTGYPLRMEVMGGEGEWLTGFDTKDIQFPKALDLGRFRLEPVGDTNVITYRRPEKVTRETAIKAVGFSPVIPANFGMGFKLQSMQTNESQKWRSVVMRLTDGLARATVYQWLSSDKAGEVQAIENSTTITVGQLRVMLVSDLSAAIRRRLLESFLLRAQNLPIYQTWDDGSSREFLETSLFALTF